MTPENWVTRLFQIIRFNWVVLLIVAGIFILRYATPLLFPFIISLLIALIMNRPVTYLTKNAKIPRWLSVCLVLLLGIAVLGGLLTLIITKTVGELGMLISKMPTFIGELTSQIQYIISNDFIVGLQNRLQFFFTQLDQSYQEAVTDRINAAVSSVSQAGQNLVLQFLGGLYNLLMSLPNLATILVIALLGAFFISKDFYRWKDRFRRLLPGGINSRLDAILLDLRNALFGFVRAQLTIISLTAAIVIIGLLIMRVPYAITIGLLTGLVDLLPYLGTGTVFIPWIIYLFFKGQYGLVIGLAIIYAVVVIFRQIIEPKVLADSVGLDPLLTLIALFVGLKLFGFLGLIIGPVSLVVINALIRANVFQDIWGYIKGSPAR
ncbi:sporulation integral membrane protein YtvI [Brevibacillus sp. B_LB10_24]|uniref:sporulation integral membrane protein YtvI n=1 Tax=Brevibacillus sp. B_LB10_24 TaxID=3380645 RepID=UPI0038BC1766